jgi:hypothetical protein
MPRVVRIVPGGMIFHVLNRGNARSQIFDRRQPYGNESWQMWIAKRFGLECTLRARGRPQKSKM